MTIFNIYTEKFDFGSGSVSVVDSTSLRVDYVITTDNDVTISIVPQNGDVIEQKEFNGNSEVNHVFNGLKPGASYDVIMSAKVGRREYEEIIGTVDIGKFLITSKIFFV